jgi:hypothetical protein
MKQDPEFERGVLFSIALLGMNEGMAWKHAEQAERRAEGSKLLDERAKLREVATQDADAANAFARARAALIGFLVEIEETSDGNLLSAATAGVELAKREIADARVEIRSNQLSLPIPGND